MRACVRARVVGCADACMPAWVGVLCIGGCRCVSVCVGVWAPGLALQVRRALGTALQLRPGCPRAQGLLRARAAAAGGGASASAAAAAAVVAAAAMTRAAAGGGGAGREVATLPTADIDAAANLAGDGQSNTSEDEEVSEVPAPRRRRRGQALNEVSPPQPTQPTSGQRRRRRRHAAGEPATPPRPARAAAATAEAEGEKQLSIAPAAEASPATAGSPRTPKQMVLPRPGTRPAAEPGRAELSWPSRRPARPPAAAPGVAGR
jgi:hypothetical protein